MRRLSNAVDDTVVLLRTIQTRMLTASNTCLLGLAHARRTSLPHLRLLRLLLCNALVHDLGVLVLRSLSAMHAKFKGADVGLTAASRLASARRRLRAMR